MEKIKNNILQILDNIQKDNIGEYSAQCAYYIFLSFMPFIILLLSLINYFNISQDTLYNIISSIVPTIMEETIFEVIREVSSKSVTTTLVPVIVTLWAARRGVYALNKGLHGIFELETQKLMYLKLSIKSIINTIEFLFFIVISLVLIIFENAFTDKINQMFNNVEFWGIIVNIIKNIIILLILFLVFLLIYKRMPSHKVTIVSQIPGAIFAVIGWILLSKIFSVYLNIFKNFTSMYGSLSTVLLVLMWVYLSMYIVFLGAEINKVIQKNKGYIDSK